MTWRRCGRSAKAQAAAGRSPGRPGQLGRGQRQPSTRTCSACSIVIRDAQQQALGAAEDCAQPDCQSGRSSTGRAAPGLLVRHVQLRNLVGAGTCGPPPRALHLAATRAQSGLGHPAVHEIVPDSAQPRTGLRSPRQCRTRSRGSDNETL